MLYFLSLIIIILTISVGYSETPLSWKNGNMTSSVQGSINAVFLGINKSFQSNLKANNTGSDEFTGRDTVLVGGRALPDIGGQVIASGDLGTPGKLSIFGSVDGPFNNGCALSVASGHKNWASQRAGASGMDYRNGTAGVTAFSDGITNCNWSGNIEPLMDLQIKSYDTTHAYLTTPMTAAQMALLHTNMYLETNSLYVPTSNFYSAVTEIPTNGTTWQEGYYKGVIEGWDPFGTFITVNAWAVPASGDMSSGQVPSTASANLDTVYTSLATPTVFVGGITGMSSHNDYLEWDDRRQSLVRSMEYDELDFRYYAQHPHEVASDGFMFSDAAIEGSPVTGINAYTTDSQMFGINTDRPTVFSVGMDPTAVLFNSAPFYVRGNQGVSTQNYIPIQDMFAFQGYADGQDGFNLLGYLKKESTSAIGATATSFHLGLKINGDKTKPEDPDGGQWGQLAWNANGANNGGISMCGGSGTSRCGVSVNYDNAVTLENTTIAGGLEVKSGNSITLDPSSGNGGPYFYASSPTNVVFASRAGDGYLDNIQANTYQENLMTPSSSSAHCTTGQFSDDVNYHYVCVATNTWKRVALTTF